MDILKAEIARAKRNITDKGLLGPDKKYFKRSDLAAKDEQLYWSRKKPANVAEIVVEAHGSTQEVPTESFPDVTEEKLQLSRKEVMRRLRERSEPVILFAETEDEAYQRLKKLEMLEPEVNKGFKNDFKAAMDKVDAEYLNEILKSGNDKSEDAKSTDVKVKDDGVTMDEILRTAKGLGKGDSALDCDVMLSFLKLLLKKWGDSLNGRSALQKSSLRGKLASATHTQTVSYIMPLFRKLKKRMVDVGILVCLVDIIAYLLDRNYLKANDAYLEMAIGNAPWPIGVTMVGIHARTGREKIFDRNVAHVLNDESQRKYIQALKRLMTQCQKFFPTDPSRSVNYESQNT